MLYVPGLNLIFKFAVPFSSLILEDRNNIFLDEAVKMLNFLIAIVIMIGITFMFCIALFALLPTPS